MITLGPQVDGKDWQNFCINLLYLRYGPDLVDVPDKHKGDGGIEAFSLFGHAFQCYAPEGINTIAQTAEKHKDKINKDLNKFKDTLKVSPLLGGTKISRWLLIVPEHCSKEVVAHCNKKTDEVLAISPSLPYITADFRVVAVDGHKFLAAEVAELASKGGFQVEASNYLVQDDELVLFSEEHNIWLENMQRKLKKLPALENDAEREELSSELLSFYLEGSNASQFYEDNYPNIADRVRFLKQQRQKSLKTDSKLKSLTISGTREEFEIELATSVPSLGKTTARTLSYAAVAEWLMICPLNPKG